MPSPQPHVWCGGWGEDEDEGHDVCDGWDPEREDVTTREGPEKERARVEAEGGGGSGEKVEPLLTTDAHYYKKSSMAGNLQIREYVSVSISVSVGISKRAIACIEEKVTMEGRSGQGGGATVQY